MNAVVVRLSDLAFLSPADLSGACSESELGESFSGLQLMCLMYAGFKRIAPEQDTGMDLNEPWITALELFNAGKNSEGS